MPNKILLRAIAVTTLLMPLPSKAASFTDESAWRTAVGTFNFENFDTIATSTQISQLPSLGIKFDPLNDGTFPSVQAYSNTGGVRRSNPNNLLNDQDFSLPAKGPYIIRPINSNDFLFGLGLWNVGGDDQLKLSFYNDNDQLIEDVISASSTGFFGIVNTNGAKRAVIDFVAGNGYAPVDDLQFAVRPTFATRVPEPTSTLSLLTLGTLGAASTLKRKLKPSKLTEKETTKVS